MVTSVVAPGAAFGVGVRRELRRDGCRSWRQSALAKCAAEGCDALRRGARPAIKIGPAGLFDESV
jgi:hypothetical protein